MFLRHVTVRKKGKVHTYWRLVRSVRMGGKVKQEVVAQLGELDAKGRLAARKAAELLVGKERTPGYLTLWTLLWSFRSPCWLILRDCVWSEAGDLGIFGLVCGFGRHWDWTKFVVS